MECNMFESNKILKVLSDDEGHTYSIQYSCKSDEKLKMYFDMYAPKLQEEHEKRYKDKFVAFRTILEEVEKTIKDRK